MLICLCIVLCGPCLCIHELMSCKNFNETSFRDVILHQFTKLYLYSSQAIHLWFIICCMWIVFYWWAHISTSLVLLLIDALKWFCPFWLRCLWFAACFTWDTVFVLPVSLVKLFVFFFWHVQSSDPADKDAWKDKGTGQLSIKCKEGISKGTKESKPTILVRNDVCFLAGIYIYIEIHVRVKLGCFTYF